MRKSILMERYFESIKNKVTKDGRIEGFFKEGNTEDIGLRQKLFVAYSLLFDDNADSIEKAVNIIENAVFSECHFSPMICIQIIKKFQDKLTKNVNIILKNYISESLPKMIDNPEYEFVGVNDNFPCMATFAAVVGGELMLNSDAVNWGEKNLDSLIKMLDRRSVQSEHTSPTYTPIQILAIAELANYTSDSNIRKKALYAEKRLAFGALSFYHPQTGKMAGPYSRAYTVDSTASIHMNDFWLYAVMGEKTVSAVDEMFDREKMNRVMHGSQWFETVQFVWIAQCDYHIDKKLIDQAIGKPFPYEVKATCEYSSSRDDAPDGQTDAVYPASDNRISCYMTKEYSLGVSRVPFHNGIQTESFYMLCKNKDKVSHSCDLQSIYLRFLINYDIPVKEESLLRDRGRKIGVQNKNIGFIGYRPSKRYLGTSVHSMKLSLIIPTIYGEQFSLMIKENAVYIRIYNTYVVFFADGDREIKTEKTKDFTMVSFYNYCGDEKTLTEEMYFNTYNGILFAAADAGECTFEEFVNRRANIRIRNFKTTHSRQTLIRNVFFEYDGKSIEIEYDVESNGVKYCLINGEEEREIYYYDSVNGECDCEKLRRLLNE